MVRTWMVGKLSAMASGPSYNPNNIGVLDKNTLANRAVQIPYEPGSVFKLTHIGGGWTFTSLHDFSGYSDGLFPVGSPVLDPGGNLFGTASAGGDQTIDCQFEQTCGVAWEITP